MLINKMDLPRLPMNIVETGVLSPRIPFSNIKLRIKFKCSNSSNSQINNLCLDLLSVRLISNKLLCPLPFRSLLNKLDKMEILYLP
mmetsp:Transcript_21111/g.2829  ORF Transcript_21111/g.2829 Transcript_21111/m.2829 type:complete len:86 (+) Transcript_21111:378-635(+)